MFLTLDSTLREGELHPGVYYTKENRVTIATALAEIGTKRIEFPIAYPSRGEKIENINDAIKIIQNSYADITAVVHTRVLKDDIELARKYDARGCAIYMAPTKIHRRDKLHGIKQSEIIDRFIEVLELAKKYGFIYRRATVEDASRFAFPKNDEDSMDFLKKLLEGIEIGGASIISIPDTSGILPPRLCTKFIKAVKKMTKLPLACHFHNDYGNALCNALQAALIPGVEEINVSILGLGARNGITDHYEFIANLEDLYEVKTGEKRENLKELYTTFIQSTKLEMPWNHPLSPNCFVEKAGIHQSQVISDPKGYFPIKKIEFDSPGEILFEAGQYMSKKIIEKLLEGYNINSELISNITNTIAARSSIKKKRLSTWEVKEILENYTKISLPIDKINKLIKGSDYAYIMISLLPQFQVNNLISVVEKWDEIERIDEVYGDVDLILLSKIKDAKGIDVVDKIRSEFKPFIIKTSTLPLE